MWAAEREADLRRGEWVDPRLARIDVGHWSADYLTTIVHLRSVTRGDYERILNAHLLPAFAKLDRLRASSRSTSVGSWPRSKRTGQAPKSLQKIGLVLRQVLELARASGAIKSNPCDGLRLPKAVQMEPIFLRADRSRLSLGPPATVRICSSAGRIDGDCVRARRAGFGSGR